MRLELDNVVREYRLGRECVRALDGVSLVLRGGAMVSVMGPSGAGKSTLLHILGALDRPTSGTVRFDGVETAKLDDRGQSDFRLRKVGFVFQSFNLMPTLAAWENVALPKMLNGSYKRQTKAEAVRLLRLVGLGDRADHRPAELSGGQMQRVAVARALMMDPPLLLADEPTGNLDTKTGAALLDLLQQLAHAEDARRLVVLVTHDRRAAECADRVVELVDGRVVRDWDREAGAAP
ncbi:ABC transporter ATP-binding protein [Nocardia transvalensis]|uniref:ABC transporter ATP-binding protein n=1 Tax=Nocardia transvalensis TaxID=37333 RepID=UPI001895CAFE|nr:ABC transporter ATP-binding protein [Nocardia transvalensis]MBF6333046.1 ABC transporter ATP-binding protein [Nocardia transvalensis]